MLGALYGATVCCYIRRVAAAAAFASATHGAAGAALAAITDKRPAQSTSDIALLRYQMSASAGSAYRHAPLRSRAMLQQRERPRYV